VTGEADGETGNVEASVIDGEVVGPPEDADPAQAASKATEHVAATASTSSGRAFSLRWITLSVPDHVKATAVQAAAVMGDFGDRPDGYKVNPNPDQPGVTFYRPLRSKPSTVSS
jgi:hypothetical protein